MKTQEEYKRLYEEQEARLAAERADHKKDNLVASAMLVSTLILAGTWIYTSKANNPPPTQEAASQSQTTELERKVLPSEGVVLPVTWGDLGARMVEEGVIDAQKLESVYARRGGLGAEEKSLLTGRNNGRLRMTSENSGYLLNLLWALGLGNKNEILENGEMTNPRYGGAGKFASTGGWTIAVGPAMNHYSKHRFFELTPEQQERVERISKGIFRPCCGNSTYFPDCNHGMAMLGLLELMASQGATEEQMWDAALAVNSYWFPNNYLTIAAYMEAQGVDWADVNPQEVLGSGYSSSQGFARVAAQVTEPPTQGGGGSGCGVESGASSPAPARTQQQGCGI